MKSLTRFFTLFVVCACSTAALANDVVPGAPQKEPIALVARRRSCNPRFTDLEAVGVRLFTSVMTATLPNHGKWRTSGSGRGLGPLLVSEGVSSLREEQSR